MSSEYGWDEDKIWNLPLCRFRQITAAIQRRKYIEARQENTRISWLARNLASFIAGGYMLDKGSENPAAEAARVLAFDDIEAAFLGVEPDTRQEPNGPGPAQDIDPNDAIARALARNSNGSFERFMTMNGQLNQRGKMI